MTSEDTRATVHQVLRRFIGGYSGEVTDDMQLGAEGLGLDSISIVEVLMEVETKTGQETATLLEDQTLTVGRVIEHLGATSRR